VVGKQQNTQILVYLPVTYVPGGTSSKAKTLGLQHLQLPDMGAGCGSPRGARIIIIGPMSCLYSRIPFLTDRSLFLSMRGPSIPKFWADLYLT
jgi:hypothetical protein